MTAATIRGMKTHVRGASLTEAMVVVGIVGLCTAWGLPSMMQMLYAQRCASVVHAWATSLQQARGEAIKRNGRVVLCTSTDGEGCSSIGGWEQGWILFHDTNNNAKREVTEPVLFRQDAIRGIHLTGNDKVGRYVSYSANGTAKLTSGAFQSGTFTMCAPSHWEQVARHIVLSPTGRVRLEKGQDKDCV